MAYAPGTVKAVAEAIKKIFTFFSAEERRKRFHFHLDKRAKKALNVAEELNQRAEEIFKMPSQSNIKDAKIRKWQVLKRQFDRLD